MRLTEDVTIARGPRSRCVTSAADIDKIYNSLVTESKDLKRRREMLYEGPTAYFRRDLIGFKNFDLFRASDLFTGIIIVNTVLFYLFGLPPWFHVAYAAPRPTSRAVHSFLTPTRR